MGATKKEPMCVSCGEHPQESMELCGQCLAIFDEEYQMWLDNQINPADERNELLQVGVRD